MLDIYYILQHMGIVHWHSTWECFQTRIERTSSNLLLQFIIEKWEAEDLCMIRLVNLKKKRIYTRLALRARCTYRADVFRICSAWAILSSATLGKADAGPAGAGIQDSSNGHRQRSQILWIAADTRATLLARTGSRIKLSTRIWHCPFKRPMAFSTTLRVRMTQ